MWGLRQGLTGNENAWQCVNIVGRTEVMITINLPNFTAHHTAQDIKLIWFWTFFVQVSLICIKVIAGLKPKD